jgi:hypothetical protein
MQIIISLLNHLHSYIYKASGLENSQKNSALWQIYQKSQQEIQADLEKPTPDCKSLQEKVSRLNQLKKVETQKYHEFCSKINTKSFHFSQKFFKILPQKISNILKRIYPFSSLFNNIKDAALNKHYFYPYNDFLTNCVENLEKKKSYLETVNVFTELNESLQKLINSDSLSTSKKFKKIQESLTTLNQKVSLLDSSNQSQLLVNAGLNSKLIYWLLPDSELGISPYSLMIGQFKVDGDFNNFRKMIIDLSSVAFANDLIDPLENPLRFDLDNYKNLRLFQKEKPVRPDFLDSYNGLICIDKAQNIKIQNFKALQQIIQEKPLCRPCGLKVTLNSEMPMDAEFIDVLSKLSETIPYIKLEGLYHLNLSSLSDLEQARFFELLPKMDAIHGNTVKLTLPVHASEWTSDQMQSLFEFWPARELNLQDISVQHLSRLLNYSPCIESLCLNQPNLTDDHFFEMHKKGYFDKLKHLDLNNCSELTTDIIPLLINLPDLISLSCPDLRMGKQQLPELKNPFDIKLFYGSAQVTKELAHQLYIGPDLLASVFQIPCARANVENIFGSNHSILDPLSVDHWLHLEDFRNLKPQSVLRSIIADNSLLINDQNLTEFVSKFPETQEISLYNCPNLTTAGIIALLKLSPQIKKIDLTGCPGITREIFSEFNLSLLENLDELIISDTKITEEQYIEVSEVLKKKIIWERKSITLSNADLVKAKSLNEALKNYLPLNRLVRLDLTGCQALTPNDFNELLNHLNLELTDPQRLNISELILTGTRVQLPWLINRQAELLGNLKLIILDNPRIINPLRNKFPTIQFSQIYAPTIESMNLDEKLMNCHAIQESLDEYEKKQKVRNYLNDRVAIELFGQECQDKPLLNRILLKRIKDCDLQKFFDLELSFSDRNGQITPIHLFKNQLYCQSPYMRNELRAGGSLFKSQAIFENQNAKPDAVRLLSDLIYGEPLAPNLPWNAVFEAAELANPHNLNIPTLFEKLKNYLYERYKELQVDVIYDDNALDIITKAISLQDEKGIALLEYCLSRLLMENSKLYNDFQPLAWNLPNLFFACQLIGYLITITMQLEEFGSIDNTIVDLADTTVDKFNQYFEQKNSEIIITELCDLPLLEQRSILYLLIKKVNEQISNSFQLFF